MRALVLSALVAVGLAAPAEAALIRYDFSGTITQDVFGTPGGPLSVGSSFTGFFIADDSTPAIPVGPGAVRYLGAVTVGAFTVGAFTATFEPGLNAVDIYNDAFFGDGFVFSFNHTDPVVGGWQLGAGIDSGAGLTDSTATAFASFTMPTTISVGMFDSSSVRFEFHSTSGPPLFATYEGEFDAITASIVPVPEPAPIALLLIGLLAVGATARRASRRACMTGAASS